MMRHVQKFSQHVQFSPKFLRYVDDFLSCCRPDLPVATSIGLVSSLLRMTVITLFSETKESPFFIGCILLRCGSLYANEAVFFRGVWLDTCACLGP